MSLTKQMVFLFFIKKLKIFFLGWTLIDTKDDCTIHTKIDADTGLTISRGETTIEKDRESVLIELNYHFYLKKFIDQIMYRQS